MLAQSVCLLALVAAAACSTRGVIIDNALVPDANTDYNALSCDPRGQIYMNLPHYEECNKYYVCDNGKEVEFTCNANLIYDFLVQGCNWPWATKCYLRTPLEDGSGSEDYDIGRQAAVDDSHFSSAINCARPEVASRLVPYKNDCQRFWKCTNGVAQSYYCSDGLFFNPSTEMCDFEGNVHCAIEPVDELKGEYIIYE